MEMRLPFAHHSFQPCSHFMSCHRMLQSLLFRWAAATLHCSRCCSRLYVAKQEIAQTDGFFLSWSGKVLFFEILTVFFGLGEWVVGGVWGWWQQSFDSPGQHFWGGGHPTNSIKDVFPSLVWLSIELEWWMSGSCCVCDQGLCELSYLLSQCTSIRPLQSSANQSYYLSWVIHFTEV